ncbi:MAG: NusG domain II-containing protein [Eubacteriales bacterium]|nr:NusG domain II-containing protein [Eubacteriales bacterium]
MKKRDWIIISVALVLIIAAFLLFHTPAASSSAYSAVIYLGGKEYARYPIGTATTVTVEQPTGEVNVIAISEHGFYMQSANCKNQSCIHQGEVTAENADTRALGAWVICLPNKVTVELVAEEQP